MLNYLKHYKKFITITVLVFLVIIGTILDFSMLWLMIIIPVSAGILLLAYEFLLSRENREEAAFWDIKEFKDHQKMSIDTLEDIFRDEHSSGGFSLRAQLWGSIKASQQLHSPLNQTPCYGYKLIVGLLRAKDLLQKKFSYSQLLINEVKTGHLMLQQDNDTISIEGEPLLNLKNRSEQIVSWEGLKKLNEKLVHKINEAVTTQNIMRSNYTAVSISEELLAPETEYTVYGVCKKSGNKCIIEGNNIVDSPESLYITSFNQPERKLKLEQIKRRIKLRRAVVFPLVLLLLFCPGLYIYDNLLRAKGEVYYAKSGSAYRIKLKDFSGSNRYDLSWDFDKSDKSESTRLMGEENNAIYADPGTDLEISRQVKETKTYTIGKDQLIKWKDVFWSLDLTKALPSPEPFISTGQKLKIYIKNVTDYDLSISFIQQEGIVTADQTWTWEAHYGTDWEYGSYAIYYEQVNGIKTDRELLLVPGDIIIVRQNDHILRSYLVGFSDAVKIAGGLGYYLLLEETSLNSKNGKLYVKNPSLADFMIYILDFQGKYKYDDYWDFYAGKAADTENGLSLMYEYSADEKEDILFYEGMQLQIIKTEYKPVWKGKLGQCPYAEFQHNKRIWEIFIE